MNKSRRIVLALIGIAALVLSGRSFAEGRVALVIGNSNYHSMPHLPNAANDASDIAAALKKLGYTLVGGAPQLDLTAAEMKLRIRDFGQLAKSGDQAVFYYAGHGVGGDNDNYLVPVDDEQIRSREDVPDFAISARSVLARLDDRAGGVSLLILDACRNNPLPGKRGADRGLQRMDAPVDGFIAYAASPNETADENTNGRNGLFTSTLLPLLDQPGLRLEDLMGKVLTRVHQQNPHQSPTWESKLTQPFYFRDALPAEAYTPPAADPAAIELAFWSGSNCASGESAGCQAYLDRYPAGQFQQLASLQLKEIQRKEAEPHKIPAAQSSRSPAVDPVAQKVIEQWSK